MIDISTPLSQSTQKTHIFYKGKVVEEGLKLGIETIRKLIDEGVPSSHILLFTPQRDYQRPYQTVLQDHPKILGGLQTATLAGLSRRSIELYWPLIAEKAGFKSPDQPPLFLTLETAQYQMLTVLQPYLDLGRFANLVIDRNRLSSQILDNLNKAALVSLDLGSIGSRLASAWSGSSEYLPVYDDAQWCIDRFREKCLNNNLVDTSLQIELFAKFLWPNPLFQQQLIATYPHIVYDHCEEDSPVAHDIMLEWLPFTTSTLVLYNEDSGYRKFLGADPVSAARLAKICSIVTDSRSTEDTALHQNFRIGLTQLLIERKPPNITSSQRDEIREHVQIISTQYQPELLSKVAQKIKQHIQEGVPSGEIVVIAPYINDTLWFPLSTLLAEMDIPSELNRPSRSLASEPIVNAMITLARIAYAGWNKAPSSIEFTQCLFQIIDGINLVRAKYLSEIVYRGNNKLTSYSQINAEMQNKIGEANGSAYDVLRTWIENYRNSPILPLDHFLRRLFGEVLSQPGFSLRDPSVQTRSIENLVESAYKFRQGIPTNSAQEILSNGKDFIEMLRNGIIAAAYDEPMETSAEKGVTIMPVIAYLLSGESSKIQFWMDAGSTGWFERIDQPLTHPYVLSRNWPVGTKWTDAEEYNANMNTMHNLLQGLLKLSNDKVYVCTSQYNETGYEQKGPLVQAAQRLL